MMLTAKTITDEQIRELRREAIESETSLTVANDILVCERALKHDHYARSRCAAILNARGGNQ